MANPANGVRSGTLKANNSGCPSTLFQQSGTNCNFWYRFTQIFITGIKNCFSCQKNQIRIGFEIRKELSYGRSQTPFCPISTNRVAYRMAGRDAHPYTALFGGFSNQYNKRVGIGFPWPPHPLKIDRSSQAKRPFHPASRLIIILRYDSQPGVWWYKLPAHTFSVVVRLGR